MIYDTFLFFNELELLDLRLRVLGPVVDKFVLVESTHTFTGKNKRCCFEEHKGQFSQYADRIVHVIVDDSPSPAYASLAWNVEYFQRNAILRGLRDAEPSDRILISDVDEIPHPDAVHAHAATPGIVGFRHSLYYYYINCKQNSIWCGTVMLPRGDLVSAQEMRFLTSGRNFHKRVRVVADQLGWHFSFLGGVDRIAAKLAAYSETQTNTPRTADPSHIRHCLETGDDLFFRQDAYAQKQFVPLDETYPEPIHDWLKDYPWCLHA